MTSYYLIFWNLNQLSWLLLLFAIIFNYVYYLFSHLWFNYFIVIYYFYFVLLYIIFIIFIISYLNFQIMGSRIRAIIYVSSRKHFYVLQGVTVLLCIYQLAFIRKHISQLSKQKVSSTIECICTSILADTPWTHV